MKVVLANGTEYQVSTVSITEAGQLCIALTGLTEPLNETIVRRSLTPEAMTSVKFYQSETEYTVFENYTLLDCYKLKLAKSSFDMTIYFSKFADSKRVDELEKNYNVLFDVINYILLELIPGIKLSI